MHVADLGPLRDRETRWVVAAAVAWSVLDICIGLFGGLFLLRAAAATLCLERALGAATDAARPNGTRDPRTGD